MHRFIPRAKILKFAYDDLHAKSISDRHGFHFSQFDTLWNDIIIKVISEETY